MEVVVERVLCNMRQRLHERLTLDDLAKTANFSKFHFARMFRQVTGVSPRRFLYALRLEEAKRLLLLTSLSVAEISYQVGYLSVGTFASRFTASVGVSPAAYRRLGGDLSSVVRAGPPSSRGTCAITGRIEACRRGSVGGPAMVGLFRDAMPEGRPTRCDVFGLPGDWSLEQVPTGRWYVLGVALAPAGSGDPPGGATIMSICGPVQVGPDRPTAYVTVRLRPMRTVDPPLLAGAARPPACS